MKKSRVLKPIALVCILIVALFFITIDLGQSQNKAKGKPDKPPGKPEPEPKPCNNNGICEYEEYDSKQSHENQPCPDCLPKTYYPLIIDQGFLQIACMGHDVELRAFQFKCIGQEYSNGDIKGIYEDTWASDEISIHGSRVVSIGDADNDGDKEIIAVVSYQVGKYRGKKTYDQKICIYETGSDGSPSWVSPYFGNPSTDRIQDCTIADADNNGENEIVLIKGTHIEIFRINYNPDDDAYDISPVWTGPEYESMIYGLDVGDADGDGNNEIVLAMFVVGAPIIWKKVGDGWSSQAAELIPHEYWHPNGFLAIDVVRVIDADNVRNEFGQLDNEIIAGGNNNRLMIWKYNKVTGNYDSVFISQDLLGFTQGVDAGDIDGDGENEIAIASSYDDNTLYVFKYLGGIIGYQIANLISRDGPNIGLSVGDLDRDGKAEIVSTTRGITIYDFIGSDIFAGYLVKTYNCRYGVYLEID